MKKTLVLMAILTVTMFPVASAATGDLLLQLRSVESSDGYALKAFDASGVELTAVTVTPNGATVDANGFTSASDNRVQIDTSSFDLKMGDGWTLTFDASLSSVQQSGYPVLCGLGLSTGWNFKAGYSYESGSAGWRIDPEGYSYTAGIQGVIDSVDTSTHTFTFLFYGITDDENNKKISLYVDGTLVASGTAGDNAFSSDDFAIVTLGGRPYSASNLTGGTSFSNVKLYEGAVVPAIPEPTTATFSLLALAGLAARRRRK